MRSNRVVAVVALWAASVLTLVLASPAPAAPLYTLLDLGTLGGTESRAFDVNELGQVVGSSVNAAGQTEAFRTAPNAPINPLTDGLGFLPGATESLSVANGINDLGQVAGWSNTAGGQRGFFTAPNGSTLTNIGVFPGYVSSQAMAINNAGQIVGVTRGQQAGTQAAFRTSSARPLDGATDNLEPASPAAPGSRGADVNESGQAAGSIHNNGFRTPPNGTIVGFGGIGSLGGSITTADAINNAGQVVGRSELPNTRWHAFRTGPNAGINAATDDLGTLGGTTSFASDINDAGVVVGTSDVTGNVGPGRAFVYVDGEGMLDLNTLVVNLPAGWNLFHAEGINNLGQIVGWATGPAQTDRESFAFLLTPVPEPSAALLLPVAGLLLARRAPRRS